MNDGVDRWSQKKPAAQIRQRRRPSQGIPQILRPLEATLQGSWGPALLCVQASHSHNKGMHSSPQKVIDFRAARLEWEFQAETCVVEIVQSLSTRVEAQRRKATKSCTPNWRMVIPRALCVTRGGFHKLQAFRGSGSKDRPTFLYKASSRLPKAFHLSLLHPVEMFQSPKVYF
jgi:hypothetical protein